MRKIIVISMITLDGVMQAPGRVIIAGYKRTGKVKTGTIEA